jgi:hypothetical protein
MISTKSGLIALPLVVGRRKVSDGSRRRSHIEGRRLIHVLGLAYFFITHLYAYTATIPMTHGKSLQAKTLDTKLFGAYEDYMDALQKQQQQYKSFMALNSASAYETEHLKVNVPPLEDSSIRAPLGENARDDSIPLPSNAFSRVDVAMADTGISSNPSSSRRYYFDYSDTAKFNFEQQDSSLRVDDSLTPPVEPSREYNGLAQDSSATPFQSLGTAYDETVRFNFEQQAPPTGIDSVVPTLPPSPECIDPASFSCEQPESSDDTVRFNFEQQGSPAPVLSVDLLSSFGTAVASPDTFAEPTVDSSGSMSSRTSPPKRNFSVSSASWKVSPTVEGSSGGSFVSPSTDVTFGTSESMMSTPSDVTSTPPVDSIVPLNAVVPPSIEPSSASFSTSTFYNDYNMMTATGNVNSEEGRPAFPSYVYESTKTNPVTEMTSSSSLSASISGTTSDLAAQESSYEYSSKNAIPFTKSTTSTGTTSAISPDRSTNDVNTDSMTMHDAGRPIFPSYTRAEAEPLTTAVSSTGPLDTPETNPDLSTNSDMFTSSSPSNHAEPDINPDSAPSDDPRTTTTATDAFSSADIDPAFASMEFRATRSIEQQRISTKADGIDMTSNTDTSQAICSDEESEIAQLSLLSKDVVEEMNEVFNSSGDDSFSWSTASKSVDQTAFIENKQVYENVDVLPSTKENSWGTTDANRLWSFDELKDIGEKSNSFMSNESFLQAITSSKPITTRKELETAVGNVESSKFGSAPGFSAISTFWKKSSMLRSLELSLQNDKNSENDKVGSSGSNYAQVVDKPLLDTRGMTERIMKRIDDATNSRSGSKSSSGSGAGGSTSYEAFRRVEDNWTKLKQSSSKSNRKSSAFSIRSPFVTSDAGLGNPRCWTKLREQARSVSTSAEGEASRASLDYDVVICGGTLGIFFALALLLRNPSYRICVVESAPAIRGRDQEWNISYNELYELVKLGVLTQSDVDDVITTEFPACRSGFKVRLVFRLTVRIILI